MSIYYCGTQFKKCIQILYHIVDIFLSILYHSPLQECMERAVCSQTCVLCQNAACHSLDDVVAEQHHNHSLEFLCP